MNRFLIPYIFIVVFLFGKSITYSQNFELKIKPLDSTKINILKTVNFSSNHKDEKSIFYELDSISSQLHEIGFINNEITEIKKDSIHYTAIFDLGENIENIKINYNSSIINRKQIKLFSSDFNDIYFKIPMNEVSSVMNSIVRILEENGNSFSEVSLKNIRNKNNQLIADLFIQKSKKRTIDKIIVNGYEQFPKSFTKNHLNLKTGTTFNESKLIFASDGMKSLQFASEIKPPEVLFTNDSTKVYLYLQKMKSNRFDGLIGFASDENGKLQFNGYLDLLLNNVFNSGEKLSLNWKSNGDDRKIFNLGIETPFIFNSNISPSANFNIYKQDSTFLNLKAQIRTSYFIDPQNSLALNFNSEKSNDLRNVENSNSITEFKNSFFGISYNYKKRDELNPYRNKFSLEFNSLFGNRTLIEESKKEKQQKYLLEASYLWTLNKKNAIYIRNISQLLISDQLYTNELFRIGGANSIRGFNEESIFNSASSVFNVEYQYYLTNLSYLYSITDFAYTENNIDKTKNNFYSFGIGYNYSLKTGMINMSYAIGKNSELPFNLNNSRFHIKLIQFF